MDFGKIFSGWQIILLRHTGDFQKTVLIDSLCLSENFLTELRAAKKPGEQVLGCLLRGRPQAGWPGRGERSIRLLVCTGHNLTRVAEYREVRSTPAERAVSWDGLPCRGFQR